MLVVALLGACGGGGGGADGGPADGFVDPFPSPDASTLLGAAITSCQSGEPVCLVRVRGVYTFGEPYGIAPECVDGMLGCTSEREVICIGGGEPTCELREEP